MVRAKYIHPFTDFGFKKLFGEEANKALLMDFLNELLPEQHKIKELTFNNTEQLGSMSFDRKAVYDIYCQNEKGEKFIVELQKAKQNYFKERTVYYSTFPIKQQADRGEWDYNLKAVYCVGILDFVFSEDKEKKEYLHTVKLKDQNGQTFYDKLTFVYIEMPHFNKTEQEIKTHFDKWLYFLKHLEDFQNIPLILKEKIFDQAFLTAELANMNRDEQHRYEDSLKIYRDMKGVVDTALLAGESKGRMEGLREGEQKGRMEEKIKMARQLKSLGVAMPIIMKASELSEKDIEAL